MHELAGELLRARQNVMILGNPERTVIEMADAERNAFAILRAVLRRLRRCPATPDGSGASQTTVTTKAEVERHRRLARAAIGFGPG